MSGLLEKLGRKAQRGSKPRCHLLTHGTKDAVAARLTDLLAPFGSVAPQDRWMPLGFTEIEEAQLHKASYLLPDVTSSQLGDWWLPAGRMGAMTPNLDIASTCTINGRPGLLLVEAKAHYAELDNESAGRRLKADDSEERKHSHSTIGAAIEAANRGLRAATGLPCSISRDSHYQMANRFAWAWKLADLGVPVVLVYLGFLDAKEMTKPGEMPFANAEVWETHVRAHSAQLFPGEVWNRSWDVNGVPLIPLIRSLALPIEQGVPT